MGFLLAFLTALSPCILWVASPVTEEPTWTEGPAAVIVEEPAEREEGITAQRVASPSGYSIEEAIRQVFQERAEEALCIAHHETRMDDSIVGEAGELGVIQIHPTWAAKMASMGLSIYDSLDRLRFGRYLMETDGWAQHWVRAAHLCGF